MAPYYSDARVTVYAGDCLDVLRGLDDASVDAVCCDPPYGLGFMGKAWDAEFIDGTIAARRKYAGDPSSRSGENGGYRSAAAEAGRYDLSPTANRGFGAWCEMWATECLRVLKPGGHMLAFGGTRTWHRLACAVEDAGFEVRDSIAWLYGSGFPKSLDVSKAIDKRPGVRRHADFAAHLAERREAAGLSRADVSERVVGTRSGACWNWEHHQFPEAKWWPALRDLLGLDEATWGSVIAEAERQKVGTRAGNRLAVAPGQGMDRSAVDLDVTTNATDDARTWQGWGTALKPGFEPIVVARKPLAGTVAANVLAHGTGALNIDAARIGSESVQSQPAHRTGNFTTPLNHDGERPREYSTAGRWPANVVLDETQAVALDAMSGEQRDGVAGARTGKVNGYDGGWGAQPEHSATYGGQGGASRYFYTAKAPGTERVKLNGTAHPTVKPLDLMRWLVRLVTPPGGLVLDPFAGSGTTVEACILEGFRCIAIEREPDYLPLIMQRINRRIDPVAAVKATNEDGGLFDLLGEGIA